NLRDAFIDRLGDDLGIRLQIGAGSSLQHVRYCSAKDNPVTFAIPQIDHQRAGRNIPHVHSCATYHSAIGGIDDVVERNVLDLEIGNGRRQINHFQVRIGIHLTESSGGEFAFNG